LNNSVVLFYVLTFTFRLVSDLKDSMTRGPKTEVSVL